MTIRAGVVGHPIAHSLSPRLHGRWLRNHGIKGRYDAIDCVPDGFVAKLAALRAGGFAGVNVTLPFKAEALALADEATETARRAGTANTLTFTEAGIHADNTDAAGFAASIAPLIGPRHRSALVLGAGGVAPAVLIALRSLGVTDVVIANRTRERAEALAARFGATTIPWHHRDDAAYTDVLVNTTSLGLAGRPPLKVALSGLPAHAVVADAVYTRGGTDLVDAARARGLVAADGLAMLVRQAIPGFARWFGVTPDDPDEAEAYLRSLDGEGKGA